MFVFEENPEFDWPVRVEIPVDGGFVWQEFKARFKTLPEADVLAKDEYTDLEAFLTSEVDRIAKVLVGWEGVRVEGGGRDLLFNEANRDKLLKMRNVRIGVTRAYLEAVVEGKQREKNSEPSPV